MLSNAMVLGYHKVVSPSEQVRSSCADQLARLVNSSTFRNAESLRRMLAYLGEQTLEGRADRLKEYTVGIEAFGKPPDYDPKTDSSVRVHLSNLRKKLDEYSRGEGVNDPLVVELPKGHFKLAFRKGPVGGTTAGGALRRWQIAAVALMIALAGTAALAVRWKFQAAEIKTERRWTPALRAFWRPYLDSERPIIVSLGTPLFVATSRGFFRDPKVNDWQKAVAAGLIRDLQRQFSSPVAAPVYIYTGVGEALGVFELVTLFTAPKRDLSVKLSNELTWEEIIRQNVIFVGPEKYNPHIPDLPEGQDFVIRNARLRNLNPRPGEPPFFDEGRASQAPDGSSLREGYALITRLTGLHGRGEITILAATSTGGSRAAVEYVTIPHYAEQLVEKLRMPSGALPKQFQVVVRARYKSDVPIEISYVTHHVLPESARPEGGKSTSSK